MQATASECHDPEIWSELHLRASSLGAPVSVVSLQLARAGDLLLHWIALLGGLGGVGSEVKSRWIFRSIAILSKPCSSQTKLSS
jgi:hypothetical protein